MNEEEFKDFKNYIKQYRNFTNDLVNKCITPYMLEQFRGYNDRFDYEPDLFAKYDVLGSIDNLQQKNQQLKEKYLNAVADYEYEKSKNQRAIEYMEQWGKEPDADMYMQMKDYNEFKYLLKILKEDNKEER